MNTTARKKLIGKCAAWGICLLMLPANRLAAQSASSPLIPGSGERVAEVGDTFENPQWSYNYYAPKSSDEQDKKVRPPAGSSSNDRWFEGALRGQPDVIQRVATPEGGIPGSTGALLLRSRDTGIPGRPDGKSQQDDLIVNVKSRLGGQVPVSQSPSCTVRVYLPPFEEWENRIGSSFAFRAGCWGPSRKAAKEREEFWPGIFIHFYSSHSGRYKEDSAQFLIRSDDRGRDFWGPKITAPGWWTLGMSFSPDGRVHYFAREGVDDLRAEDHLASHVPYGIPCQHLDTFFFNVVSADNGRDWSTPWVIDDAKLFTIRRNLARRPTAR